MTMFPKEPKEQEDKNKLFTHMKASQGEVIWSQDPKSYFTIMPYPNEGVVKVRAYDTNNNPVCLIQGATPQQIYYKITNLNLVTKLEHAAYLGKELYKAFLCLRNGLVYNQDDPVDFTKKLDTKEDEQTRLYNNAIKTQTLPESPNKIKLVLNEYTRAHLEAGTTYTQNIMQSVLKQTFPHIHEQVLQELIKHKHIQKDNLYNSYTVINIIVGENI